MSPRFIFILALAFGAYVLGAKAGRPRYEQIRTSVTSFWDDPKVKATRKRSVGRRRDPRWHSQKKSSSAGAKRVDQYPPTTYSRRQQ